MTPDETARIAALLEKLNTPALLALRRRVVEELARRKGRASGARARKRRRAVALARKGLTRAQLCARLGVDDSTVGRWIREGLIPRPPRQKVPPNGDLAARDAHILALVRKGHSHARIARSKGLTRQRVSQIVKAHRAAAE